MNTAIQRASFLCLLAAVTAGFVWILLPFFGAVMWAIALAILLSPIYKRLCRHMGQHKTWVSLATLLLCLLVFILSLAMICVSLVQEGAIEGILIESDDIFT